MKLLVKLLSVSLFVISVFSMIIFAYFGYTVSEIQPDIKIVHRSTVSEVSYDFKNILSRFFNPLKESPKLISSATSFPFLPSLKAIFWNEKHSIALLKLKNKTLWVKRGDLIEGWKVKNILPNSVVLSFNKKEVRLKLFKTQETSKNQSSLNTNSSGVFVISREKVRELTADIGSLFSKIGLRPYIVKGLIKGLQVVYIAPGSIFQKVGLKVGDVILSINDVPVKTNEDAFRIIEILQSSSFIEVKIKRGDRILRLKVEVI